MNLCLFDLDHTLLPLDSDHEFGEFLIRQGLTDADAYRLANDGFYQQYCEGTLVLADYIRFTTSVWRQMDEAAQQALQQAFMEQVIYPAMQPQALELVEQHRAQGDLLAIVTGEIDGVPSFREGKITRVEQWLSGMGRQLSDFDRVSFYSDSPNDLPLLERANDPVATNPSPALEEAARERGWRILRLFA